MLPKVPDGDFGYRQKEEKKNDAKTRTDEILAPGRPEPLGFRCTGADARGRRGNRIPKLASTSAYRDTAALARRGRGRI
jgi:hypothetical protein